MVRESPSLEAVDAYRAAVFSVASQVDRARRVTKKSRSTRNVLSPLRAGAPF